MNTVISVENLSKVYRLGQIGTGTFSRDLELWFARLRGKPNPFLKIGQQDHGNRLGEDLWALRDVSFTVEQGEVLGIIGRNGAGKSTLLKILSRVTAPTSGRIRVKGRIASLLEVGTGFHPELTGRENVYLNGAILGMTRLEVDRKFDEIVAFAEVEKFIDTPVKRYSSGMYVRLAFAVAAHLEPEILVVDEVLAVGDAEFQKKALGKMDDVAKGGRTVLFVSHNMATIQSLCKNCALLEMGKIVELNTTERIIDLYLTSSNRDKCNTNTFHGTIKNIEVINSTGQVNNHLKTGEPFKIQILIDTRDTIIENPVVGIGINNSIGTRIFTVGTYFSDRSLGQILGKKTIECSIPANSLVPGNYYIKIAIGKSFIENFEEIENATDLIILPSDYFGNGKLPVKSQGFILVKSEWKVLHE